MFVLARFIVMRRWLWDLSFHLYYTELYSSAVQRSSISTSESKELELICVGTLKFLLWSKLNFYVSKLSQHQPIYDWSQYFSFSDFEFLPVNRLSSCWIENAIRSLRSAHDFGCDNFSCCLRLLTSDLMVGWIWMIGLLFWNACCALFILFRFDRCHFVLITWTA